MPARVPRDELLDRRAAAARLGISLKTFDKRRERAATGEGPQVPPPDVTVARTPMWYPRTIDNYALTLPPRRRGSSEPAAATR